MVIWWGMSLENPQDLCYRCRKLSNRILNHIITLCDLIVFKPKIIIVRDVCIWWIAKGQLDLTDSTQSNCRTLHRDWTAINKSELLQMKQIRIFQIILEVAKFQYELSFCRRKDGALSIRHDFLILNTHLEQMRFKQFLLNSIFC